MLFLFNARFISNIASVSKCDQVLNVQRIDQMRPFHILLDKMGLDQMDSTKWECTVYDCTSACVSLSRQRKHCLNTNANGQALLQKKKKDVWDSTIL